MAATNYTPIQLYFSTTASAVPLAANLAQGELAINITDGKLYYEDNAGVVQVIATKGAGTIGGSTTQIQYNNAGALAGNAAMTFNSGTSTTTLTTLNLTNALGATYGGTAQSAYAQGDFLYASATNTLSKLSIGTVNYILTSTGSVPQWSAPSSIIVQTATNLAGGAGGSVPYQSAVDTTTFLAIGAANRVMTSSGTAPQWVTSLTGLTGVSSSSITNTSLTSGRVVYSTTGGAQTDDADLTFDGTTLSAGGYSTTGLSTLVKTVKIGDSNFSGVAVFAPATPAKLYIGTGTVTDTTSAIGATNATGAVASLAITPIAATNTSVTYTNAATLYIAGAPSAGTNVTLTNPYSLYVAAGAAYFGGGISGSTVINDGTANGVMYLNGSKQITTGAVLTFDGTRLTSTTGKFGGGSAPNSASLMVNNATNTATGIQIFQEGIESWIMGMSANNGGLAWSASGAEQMRINTTGFAVGTSSVITKLTVNGTDGITMQRSTANAFAPVLDYLKSRGTSASPAGVSDGDGLFLLRVAPYQGSSFTYLNSMTVEVDGGYTAGQNPPTRQIFYTNAANGAATNRLTILSSGNVGVNVANPLSRFSVQYADSTPSSSGNMTSGAVFSYDPGGVALNVGSSSGGYTYFNSAYANNAGVPSEWRFYQGGNQSLTLNTSAQLMLGTTTAQASFTIGTGGTTNTNAIIVGPTSGTAAVGDKIVIGFQLRNTAGGGSGNQYASAIAGIQDKAANNGGGLAFYTQASAGDGTPERGRITNGGQFLFGATTENVSRWGRANFSYPSSTSNPTIGIQNTTARASGNKYGIIFADNTDESNAAVYVNQNNSGNNGADLLFGTNAGTGGATFSAITERMRITSAGSVCIGTATVVGTRLNVVGGANLTYWEGGNSSTNITSGTPDQAVWKINDSTVGNFWQTRIQNSSGNTMFSWGAQSTSHSSNFNNGKFFVDGQVVSTPSTFVVDCSTGYTYCGYSGSNGAYKLQVNGQIFATNATIATSDGRYKENVQELTGALDLINALRPVSFNWKKHNVHNFNTEDTTVGFIAQEVKAAMADKPYVNSFVKTNICTSFDEVEQKEMDEEFMGFAETNMVAILTKALQELNAKFDAYVASHH